MSTANQQQIESVPSKEQEEAQEQARQAANEAAARVIKDYLKAPPSVFNLMENSAWYLHILCRAGNDEDYGFDDSEFEAFLRFFETLTSFFLRSNNAKRFNKHIGNNDELGDRLKRLMDYFRCLVHSKRVEAELYLISAEHNGTLSEKRAEDMIWLYQRERALLEAKNSVMSGNYTHKSAA